MVSKLLCFLENKTGSYINFCSKNALGLIFRGCFILQSCHLQVATQGWKAGFHLTRAYFGGRGRAYMMSILKYHIRVRSYFWGNRVRSKVNCN